MVSCPQVSPQLWIIILYTNIHIYSRVLAECRISHKHTKYTRHRELLQYKCYKDFINSIITIILSFCSYVEHRAFMKLFHLLLWLAPLPPSSLFQPCAVPILLFFSWYFLVYPSSWYPEGFSPVHVFLLFIVVYTVYG